ncbi:hypothetical protein ACFLZG_02655 [Thermodesulfobacteriota bacterium]
MKKALLEGEKALVLMRLSATLDDKPMTNALYDVDGGFSIELARMDTGEIPRWGPPLSPSQHAQKEGWVYLTLEPGHYYLTVIPPGSSQNQAAVIGDETGIRYRLVKGQKIPIPNYWFHIPKGKKVFYLGSFSVACKGGGLFGRLCKESSEIRVSDETELALQVAQNSFGQYGLMSTLRLRNLDEPPKSQDVKNFDPMGLVIGFAKIIESPNWHMRSISRGLLLGGDTTYDSDIKAEQEPEPPSAGKVIGGVVLGGVAQGLAPLGVMLYAAYLPFGIVGGAISGELNEREWQNSLEEFNKELGAINPAETIRPILLKYGVNKIIEIEANDDFISKNSQSGLKSILQFNIIKVRLRECMKGHFSLELGCRVRLWNLPENELSFDRAYFCGTGKRNRLYELAGTECRKKEDFLNTEKESILWEEVSKGIQSVIEKACKDIGFNSG